MHSRKACRVFDARLDVFEQRRGESRLVVEPGQEREIDVDRLTRSTPLLDREAPR